MSNTSAFQQSENGMYTFVYKPKWMDGLCGFGYICVETFAQYGHNSIYIFSFVTFEQCFLSLYKCVCVCVCLCRLSLSIEIKTSKLLQKVKSSGWLANTIHCIVDSMVYFLPPPSLSLSIAFLLCPPINGHD